MFPEVVSKGLFPQNGINRGINFDQSEKPEHFPWQAAILFKTISEKEPHCGGVLINEKYVLSAAHCFFECEKGKCDERKAKDIEVVLGEYDWTKNRYVHIMP